MTKEIKQSVFVLLFIIILGSVVFLFSKFNPVTNAPAGSQAAAVNLFGGQFWYVAPDGSATGNGTISSPWDLRTALANNTVSTNKNSVVKPGDTIWVRGGTYPGTYYANLRGSTTIPIIVRAYPGERATIDGGDSDGKGIFVVDGQYTWYWGLEIMSSNPTHITTTPGSWPTGTEIPVGDGVQFVQTDGSGVGVKFINNIIHDTRQGMSYWKQAIDGEIYGNLIYYNGWSAPDRGHGHGIYTQNSTSTKYLEDNIIFKQFSDGIQAYGTSNAYIYNYDIRGNTIFDNGLIAGPNGGGSNMQIGGGNPAKNITIDSNSFYRSSGAGTINMGDNMENIGLTITNNYIDAFMRMSGWNEVVVSDNTIVGSNTLIDFRPNSTLAGIPALSYNWDSNTYFSDEDVYRPFGVIATDTSRSYMFPDWKTVTGFDVSSSYVIGVPTGLNIFVRPNKYETGRANITIYNWNKANSVSVPLSGTGLVVGDSYEIRDAQNFFGPVVASGVWYGDNVNIPMSGLTVAAPSGPTPVYPVHTAPEFGTFVVLKTESSVVPPPPPVLAVTCDAEPDSVFIGETVIYTATTTGGVGNNTYVWSGDEELSGSAETTSKAYQTVGTKIATVTATSGTQTATANCMVTVAEPPPPLSASCTAVPSSVVLGDPVTFSASVTGGIDTYAYAWSGDENLSGTTATITKTYTTTGTKTATVTVTSGTQNVNANCAATVTAPEPVSDTIRPVITAFSVPQNVTTLTIPITTFTATDNVGVTGYLVNESSKRPSVTDSGWSATPPSSYTAKSARTKTLYAWVKDAAGNVSYSKTAKVTITVSKTFNTKGN